MYTAGTDADDGAVCGLIVDLLKKDLRNSSVPARCLLEKMTELAQCVGAPAIRERR
jgi:hypothetical protein